MMIDEAIKELKLIADYQEYEYGKDTYKMYMQVINWLEELKWYKSKFTYTEEAVKEISNQSYNKAIDDFNCYVQHEESIGNIKSLDDYDRIAEQLRIG